MVYMTQLVGYSLEKAVELIADCLRMDGFRIFTRINLHERVKEKTGKDIYPIIVLGVLKPNQAIKNMFFRALRTLMIRDLADQGVSVEISQIETDQVLYQSLTRIESELAA